MWDNKLDKQNGLIFDWQSSYVQDLTKDIVV